MTRRYEVKVTKIGHDRIETIQAIATFEDDLLESVVLEIVTALETNHLVLIESGLKRKKFEI